MPDRTLTADQLTLALAATARAERERGFAHLWRMTRTERVAAMWRGDLSLAECLAWSRRLPDEVPLIGKEFAYIVMRTPDWLGD
jgi:hypothetical protein